MSLYRKEIQERHVFHIITREPLPSKWRHFETDGGTSGKETIAFDFFWIRLDSSIPLAGGQAELLPEICLGMKDPQNFSVRDL